MGYDFSHFKSLPKVSCQCITYGRTTLLNEAVYCFLKQDYPGEKELIILNDYSGMEIKFNHKEIKIINLKERIKTIGEKRNLSVDLSSGEILFPWDDDDIHLFNRISHSISKMINKKYYQSNKFWYWQNGIIVNKFKNNSIYGAVAYSKSMFMKAGRYSQIQSGQDQDLENRFDPNFKYNEDIPVDSIYYIYRFGGTKSYHLSAYGYGKGYDEVKEYTLKKELPKIFIIEPQLYQNYKGIVQNIIKNKLFL
jgi:hypothetical protein